MTTRALDVVTIMHALAGLGKEIRSRGWSPINNEQLQIAELLEKYGDALDGVTGLEALASRSYEELNAFLVSHKFKPVIEPFDPESEIGIVSILDKLVKWLHGPGEIVDIRTADGNKPGFELPNLGVNIYSVDRNPRSHLLELLTKSNDTLWLLMHDDDNISGIDMAKLAIDIMGVQRRRDTRFAGAKIPMLDFEIDPDIGWMNGMDTTTEDGLYFYVSQAKQQYKLRMDDIGARIKAATSMVAKRMCMPGPVPFVVDRPFYGWWTQKGVPLPMAAFFADYDAMKKPAGSLEDL